MLPKEIKKIAIIGANSELHAITVSHYHPLCEVTDRYMPADLAVFIGYNPGMDLVAAEFKQKGVPTVCWWIGTDIMNYSQAGMFPDANIPFLYFNQKSPETLAMLKDYAMKILRFCDMPDKPQSARHLYNFHVCPSENNRAELMSSGINATVQPVVPAAPYKFIEKLPKKKKVMVYLPIGRHEQTLNWKELKEAPQHLYMLSECAQIMEKCPNIEFSIYSNPCKLEGQPKNVTSLGVIENSKMDELYAEHNIVMRWTAHEGLAQSVIECKQAGLQAVTNYDLPHVVKATTVDEFVKALNSVDIKPDKKGSKYYQKEFSPLNVLEKWKGFLNEWKKACDSNGRVAFMHTRDKAVNGPNNEGLQSPPDNGNDSVNNKQI